MKKDEEKKYKKVYMLAYYYPPGSIDVNFVRLNATNLKDALIVASCMFGKSGQKNLYYKEFEIE